MREQVFTDEEIRIKRKYLKMCDGFGVAPVSDYENILIEKNDTGIKIPKEKVEVINLYIQKCKDFGYAPKDIKTLRNIKTSKLWDWVLKITDKAVEEKFSSIFKKMKEIEKSSVLRRKRKAVITMLYDEGIYVIPEEAKGILTATTNDEFTREYKKLGGTEKLVVLKEIDETADLDIEDETNNDDDYEEE